MNNIVTTNGTGLRFNEGKLRHDLVHPWAHEQMVKILTKGSLKYAPRNWEKGMAWSNVLSSLKRHLSAIEKGEDYDYDENCEDCKKGDCKSHSGELHAAHLACNAHFLTAYYKIYPQGDDRNHAYLNPPKIGLDIDHVLCDWEGPWREKFGYKGPAQNWNFSYDNHEHFKTFDPIELEKFYLNLPPLIDSKDMPFEPCCYITSRSIPVELTKKWIQKNGFSTVPVHSVGFGQSKVEVAKQAGIDIFVDDCYKNFVELNQAGICTFLYSAPHNMKYNVGARRLNSLKELV